MTDPMDLVTDTTRQEPLSPGSGGAPHHGGDASRADSDLEDDLDTLYIPLRSISVHSSSPSSGDFLPNSLLASLLSPEMVLKELKRHINDEHELQSLVARIGDSCQKIFSILVLIGQSAAIRDLRHGIHDGMLPLQIKNIDGSGLALHSADETDQSQSAFGSWPPFWVELFYRYQWMVLAPEFERPIVMPWPGKSFIPHYDFESERVLPFTRGSVPQKEGGYATVSCVEIFYSHHNFNLPKDSRVALKRLHSLEKNDFVRERDVFLRLNRVAEHLSLPLVPLLASFSYRQSFYLMMPWASGNLLDLWKSVRMPSKERETIVWAAEQMHGLAAALDFIHNPPDDSGLYGRHGDIKPENILRFRDEIMEESIGTLKLSDFGLAYYRTAESRSNVSASRVGRSMSYRAPEFDTTKEISRSIDMWQLGCVFLEMATWLLMGWQGVEEFSELRVKDEMERGLISEDKFFSVTPGFDSCDTDGGQAVVKPIVLTWIRNLQSHEECTKYLHDLLDCIKEKLLVIDHHARVGSRDIEKILGELLQTCKNGTGYGNATDIPTVTLRSPTPLTAVSHRYSRPHTLDLDSEVRNRAKGASSLSQAVSIPSPWEHRSIPPRDASGPELFTATENLEKLIRKNFAHYRGQRYLPLGVLERIICEESVAAELGRYPELRDDGGIKILAKTICGRARNAPGGDDAPKKSYLRIFALLVVIDKTDSITEFLNPIDGVSDTDLPLVDVSVNTDDLELRKQSSPDFPLSCFSSWSLLHRESFLNYQWGFLAPYLSDDSRDSAPYFDFSAQVVLPLVEDPREMASKDREGGFGRVSRIFIHHSHHNFRINPQLGFALKVVYSELEGPFLKELNILNKIRDTHPNLITLLAAWKMNGRFYFLFPWAEHDLASYWESNPEPLLTLDFVLWIANQSLGIANALKMIHEPTYSKRNTISGVLEYGRHGDLKPSNILWLQSSDKGDRGRWVINDFSLSSFNREYSRSNIPNRTISYTYIYRPPECDVDGGTISRAFDIWTLGCLFLEMITWLLGGTEALHQLEKLREGQMSTGHHNLGYFEAVVIRDSNQYAVDIKPSIKEWIRGLHRHSKCSHFIRDFLDMIENNMLVIEPRERASASNISAELTRIYRWSESLEEVYCIRPNPLLQQKVKSVQVRIQE